MVKYIDVRNPSKNVQEDIFPLISGTPAGAQLSFMVLDFLFAQPAVTDFRSVLLQTARWIGKCDPTTTLRQVRSILTHELSRGAFIGLKNILGQAIQSLKKKKSEGMLNKRAPSLSIFKTALQTHVVFSLVFDSARDRIVEFWCFLLWSLFISCLIASYLWTALCLQLRLLSSAAGRQFS